MESRVVVYDESGGRKSQQRRAPLRSLPVNLNKAAEARAKAAQGKKAAAEARARELREQLTGGGWCKSIPKPSWIDHDKKVLKKLNEEKKTGKDETNKNYVKENDDDVVARAWSLLEQWTKVLGSTGEIDITLDDIHILKTALNCDNHFKSSQQRPPSLVEARAMLKAAMERLMAGEASAEVEVDKMDLLIQTHPEFIAEQKRERESWNAAQACKNVQALASIRRVIPPDIATRTLVSLQNILPNNLARRIFSKRVLHLVRMPKNRISRLHIVELRGVYNASGLDLDEARAVYTALPQIWENDTNGDKAKWAEDLRHTLVDLVKKYANKPAHSRYSDIKDLFDINEPLSKADDHLAVRSGINDGAAERAAELDDLRARRKLAKDTKSLPFVVHLRSPSRKISPKRNNKLACATTGNNLMDQLKARLRARNEATGTTADRRASDLTQTTI